nr:uncharacterized protein LOC109722227 [Ipomoea batatas]
MAFFRERERDRGSRNSAENISVSSTVNIGKRRSSCITYADITLSSFDSRISPFIFTVPPRLSRAILLASASIRNKRKRAGIRDRIIELENTMIIGGAAVVRSFTGGVSDAVQKLAESHGDAMPRPPREFLKLHSLARPQKRKITRRRHVISGRSLRHGNNNVEVPIFSPKHSNSTLLHCKIKLYKHRR